MFTIYFRRVQFICGNNLYRSIRGGKLRPNPGLENRAKVFLEDGLELDDNAEEFFEESESDFSNVGQSYKDHMLEAKAQKESLKHKIVIRKYFKESAPNLLTWSEKEQIRHLSTENPDEWTPERLAESFPVTAAVIEKLIKYPWKPSSRERIARHDASALRNWKELKDGTLDIPPDIREHFLKFSNRTIPPLNVQSLKTDITPPDIGEFQAIVDNCAAKENIKNESVENSETTSSYRKPDKKRLTLEALTDQIKADMKTGQEVNLPDKIILDTIKSTKVMSSENISNNIVHKSSKPESIMNLEDETKTKIPYPERIRIPKSAYKRGATYRVDDCYYDDDGRFLYRVLGIVN